ncbi:MAG: pyridoxamine 5'-phosphate oxidase family protein [Eubacteriales bacterium]
MQSSRRGVLAVNGDDGYPYAIPINYVYDDDAQKIYFHGARICHKVDAPCLSKMYVSRYLANVNHPKELKIVQPLVQTALWVFPPDITSLESGARATILLKRFAMKY